MSAQSPSLLFLNFFFFFGKNSDDVQKLSQRDIEWRWHANQLAPSHPVSHGSKRQLSDNITPKVSGGR